MSDYPKFRLIDRHVRQRAVAAVTGAPEGWWVLIKPPTRSLDQNARMWAMLTDVSEQVEWYGKHLTPTVWKVIFSAALKKQEVVPGLDGNFVAIGESTSQMSVQEMNDLMTLMEMFGAQRDVHFREPEYA